MINIKNKICLRITNSILKNIVNKIYKNKILNINFYIKDKKYDDNDIINFINYNYINLLIILDIKKSNRIIKKNEIEIIYNEKYKKSFDLANKIKNSYNEKYKCDLKRINNNFLLNKANMPSLIIKIDEDIINDNIIYENILKIL